ncbi:uncharacterized protein LY89DRAFT_258849 [Mollisia scopiformis]|uniref:Uncharacterized protein n=1 Tax=Mollisia scopiformis TaxID=149040 RepID=A0A132BDA8_MOLSC|nr:uncharacterized protein LY89DRAFT_258849 [Mollisia scopiformis]KUJ10368.1 hypothetical protein LY89DRAFT_258849 [Mollisia scopiformis]
MLAYGPLSLSLSLSLSFFRPCSICTALHQAFIRQRLILPSSPTPERGDQKVASQPCSAAAKLPRQQGYCFPAVRPSVCPSVCPYFFLSVSTVPWNEGFWRRRRSTYLPTYQVKGEGRGEGGCKAGRQGRSGSSLPRAQHACVRKRVREKREKRVAAGTCPVEGGTAAGASTGEILFWYLKRRRETLICALHGVYLEGG